MMLLLMPGNKGKMEEEDEEVQHRLSATAAAP